MSSEATVKCPTCGNEFQLTDALAGPLLAATKLQMQAKIDVAESAARTAKMDADIAKADIDRDIKFKVAEETERIRTVAVAEATNAASKEVGDLRTKLAEAQKAQAEALRKERELADKERELDLTIETRVAAEVNRATAKAESAVDERYKLKLLEKDTLLESLTRKIEELNQKADSKSQQLQGEVQELDLQAKLAAAFPSDDIGEVAKGIRGADVQQKVVSPSGNICGLLLWESKRTKTFSAGWLPKLRTDGREARADILILVSHVVPDDVQSFSLIEGVWVCQVDYALPLAAALREVLLSANIVRQAQAGMATKSEVVYQYLTGPQFRRRVEAVVESFTTMQTDLDAEKRAITRAWSKRSTQLENALTATAGLVGDIQGVGAEMPEIEGISFHALGSGSEL